MGSTSTSPEASQDQAARPARSLWRNRDFLLIWSGQMASTLGTNISRLALPLLVLALTRSPALAGLLAAVRELPYLLVSLPAGALVDRWDRKRAMIICDLLLWLALGSVPLAFVLGHLTLIQLYLVALVEGTAYVVFSLAQISALPHVVDPAHLPRAYALDTTTEYMGILLGPGMSGFIFGYLFWCLFSLQKPSLFSPVVFCYYRLKRALYVRALPRTLVTLPAALPTAQAGSASG